MLLSLNQPIVIGVKNVNTAKKKLIKQLDSVGVIGCVCIGKLNMHESIHEDHESGRILAVLLLHLFGEVFNRDSGFLETMDYGYGSAFAHRLDDGLHFCAAGVDKSANPCVA